MKKKEVKIECKCPECFCGESDHNEISSDCPVHGKPDRAEWEREYDLQFQDYRDMEIFSDMKDFIRSERQKCYEEMEGIIGEDEKQLLGSDDWEEPICENCDYGVSEEKECPCIIRNTFRAELKDKISKLR